MSIWETAVGTSLGIVFSVIIIGLWNKLCQLNKKRRINYLDDGYDPVTDITKNQRKAPFYMRLGLQPPKILTNLFKK